ncbi:hypothetical protein [Streptomyces sp. NPDC001820]|uniref:hypothetical protein n=1 Tax=Streptomyces sp. NPDC001820 TaxID=3364613 RepID=UPI0036A52C2C
MNPDSTTGSRLGPLPRRNRWTVGGAIASLALVLATGATSPAGAAAQAPSDHVSASVRADGKEKCKDGPAAQTLVVLGGKDCYRGPTGPTGPTGPQGDPGDPGPTGATGATGPGADIDLERHDGPLVTVPAGASASSTALCPDGYEAISWGFTSSVAVFVTPGAAIKEEGAPEGWTVYGTNPNTEAGLIQAFVYCDAP